MSWVGRSVWDLSRHRVASIVPFTLNVRTRVHLLLLQPLEHRNLTAAQRLAAMRDVPQEGLVRPRSRAGHDDALETTKFDRRMPTMGFRWVQTATC